MESLKEGEDGVTPPDAPDAPRDLPSEAVEIAAKVFQAVSRDHTLNDYQKAARILRAAADAGWHLRAPAGPVTRAKAAEIIRTMANSCDHGRPDNDVCEFCCGVIAGCLGFKDKPVGASRPGEPQP